MNKQEITKIQAVLYCHEFICNDFQQPSMAAEMVFSQLQGTRLKVILEIAEREGLDLSNSEIKNYFS